jgi:hypothetical protein
LGWGSLSALFPLSALADHNSIHGAGRANPPNDIHNTRIEDDLSSTEFRDFVAKGAGVDTVNRYLDAPPPCSPGQAWPARVAAALAESVFGASRPEI